MVADLSLSQVSQLEVLIDTKCASVYNIMLLFLDRLSNTPWFTIFSSLTNELYYIKLKEIL